jgi:hypothetical protein
LQAELDKWGKLDVQKKRTLPGLMELLQADERPEADQPEVYTHLPLLHASANAAQDCIALPLSIMC